MERNNVVFVEEISVKIVITKIMFKKNLSSMDY